MKDILNKIIKHNEKWSDIEYCLRAVKENGMNLKFVRKQTLEICLEAIEENEKALQYILKQSPEICLAAVKKNGLALEHVRIQTPEICLAAVKQEGYALQYVKNQTPEICCGAMLQSLDSSQFIDLSGYTGERHDFFGYMKKIFCVAATHMYLKLIGEPFIVGVNHRKWSKWNDSKYYSVIIKHKSTTLRYVKNQTQEICLEAVWRNERTLQYVVNQTPEICMEAVCRNSGALRFVRRQTPEICFEAIKQDSEAYKYVRLPSDKNEERKFIRKLGLLLLSA